MRHPRWAIFATAVIAACAVRVAAEERMDAETLYRAAFRAFNAGEYDAAARHFGEFASRYAAEPEMQQAMPHVYYALGCAQYNTRQMQPAIEAFNEHLKRDPKSAFRAEVMFRIGNAQFAGRNYADAVMQYQQLLREFPSAGVRDDARFQLAVALLLQEQYSNAIPLLAALSADTADAARAGAARAYHAQAAFAAGRHDECLRVLRTACAEGMPPDHLILLSTLALQLGDAFYESYELEKALDAYRCVLHRDELLRRQEARLGALAAECRRLERMPRTDLAAFAQLERAGLLEAQARDQIATLSAQGDFDTSWLMRLGRCLYEMGALWEACIAFQELVRSHPASELAPGAHASLLYCLAQMRLFDEVIREADAFVACHPGHPQAPQAAFLKCEALVNAERFDQAEQALIALLDSHPGHPARDRAAFYLHLSQAMQEKFPEARAGLAAWLAEPGHSNSAVRIDVEYWQAMAAVFSGDYSNAQPLVEAFLSRHPDAVYAPDMAYRLGVVHYMRGQYRNAAMALVKFVRGHPDHPMIWEARVLRGDALAAMGELGIALSAYAEAGPDSGPYYHYAVAQRGKCHKALEDFTNMVALYEGYITNVADSPNVVEGIYWLGWAHRRLGHAGAAREAYWSALLTYGNRKDWQGFEQILGDMRSLYPGSNGVAELAMRLEDESDAARSKGRLTLGSRLDIARARLYEKEKRAADAREAAAAFAARYTTNVLGPDGLLFLATRTAVSNRGDSCAAVLHLLARAFPASAQCAEAEMLLARRARAEGDLDACGRLVASAAAKAQEVSVALEITMEKARWLAASDRLREAIAAYEEVLANKAARGPLWPEALYGIAAAYEAMRDFRAAIPYYQRIYVMYAGHAQLAAQAYYHSGRCFERMGDVSAAIRTFKELAEDERFAAAPETARAQERLSSLLASNTQ
ncbi:tetratricopeptide repeat protein [bacterium]|nr:tetratricopeptide repeat protein [bacterium]